MEVNKQNVSFSERLSIAFAQKNIKQADLAKKYDYLSTALINKFFKSQKTITDIFVRLCDDEGINIHWICTGKGNMFKIDENKIEKTNDLLVNLTSVEHIVDNLKQLSSRQQEYYYHRIKADVIKNELKEEQ